MQQKTVTIAARFNGPPTSGNGGYTCGLLAQHIEGPSEVTLRMPPPLQTPLTLTQHQGALRLLHGEALVAEARPAQLHLQPPPAPSLEQAAAARDRYRGLLTHRYGTCFVCGPGRPAHDGLDIFTGPVDGRDMVACVWTPGPAFASADGSLDPLFIHAALDCPSYWALPRAGEMMGLLARLTASIDGEPPCVDEPLIVAAWALGSSGRKHRGASALYAADGRVIARSEALWIEPRA